MPKEKERGLSKQEGALPALNNGELIVGQENVETEDIVIPRVRLLQPISPEVVDRKGNAGDFINSMTGETLKEMDILIFWYLKSRLLFNRALPGGNNEGIACRSVDGKVSLDGKKCGGCPATMWDTLTEEQRRQGQKSRGPECDTVHNFPCLILNSNTPELPISLSLRRTSANQAKQLISLVKLSRINWWNTIFRVTSKLTRNDRGAFYVYEVKTARPATEDERKKGEMFYRGLATGRKLVVHEEEKDDFRKQDDEQ